MALGTQTKAAPGRPLNARMRKFVAAYAGDGVAAARAAGYTGDANALAVTASKLLRHPKVSEALKGRENTEVRPLVATRQDRQAFWTAVMKGEVWPPVDPATPVDLSKAAAPDLEPPKLADRLKASELLGKSEADFTDKLAGPDGEALVVEIRMLGGAK